MNQPDSKALGVPEGAVEAALTEFLRDRISPPEGEELNVIRQDVREALEAAYPEIHRAVVADLGKRLFGDEARDRAREGAEDACVYDLEPNDPDYVKLMSDAALRAAWNEATGHTFSLPDECAALNQADNQGEAG